MIRFLKYIFIWVSIVFLIACSHDKKENTTHFERDKEKDSLAFELCKIYGSDQGIRDMKLITRKEIGALRLSPYLDSINFFKILDFTKKYGYPTKKLLGEKNASYECVIAAPTAVLLHTPHMLVNNKEYLDVFIEETKKGNLDKETLALFLDKYYVIRRDKQGNRRLLYGSQFGKPCIKYRRQSDSVRAVIGLEPLPDSSFVKCKS